MSKKKQPLGDWHKADIKAALEKAGTSLRQLARENDLDEHSMKDVLRRKWPRAERIVAAAIGHPPQEIWPSRYAEEAKRVRAAA